MSICWPTDSGVNFFDDNTPGPQGVEGWWSDTILPGRRIFFFSGTWWKKDTKLPFWGFKDIFVDANFFPKRIEWDEVEKKNMKAHRGFLDYGNIGWDLLRDRILETEDPIFMGHSLGGAIAQIIALRYAMTAGKDCECYTGGSPTSLWNLAAKEVFNKRIPDAMNFKNGWDIVSSLHNIGWIAGLYTACESFNVNGGSIQERLNAPTFFGKVKQLILLPFTDHFADKYDAILDPFIRGAY